MSSYLSSESLCDEKQEKIVSKEKGLQHIAINKNENNVRQYKPDIIILEREGKRCDFLVLNDTEKSAYFIELKGPGKVDESIDQIENTRKILANEILGYIYNYRIVCNKIPRANTGEINGYKIKCTKRKGNCIVRNDIYKEEI